MRYFASKLSKLRKYEVISVATIKEECLIKYSTRWFDLADFPKNWRLIRDEIDFRIKIQGSTVDESVVLTDQG